MKRRQRITSLMESLGLSFGVPYICRKTNAIKRDHYVVYRDFYTREEDKVISKVVSFIKALNCQVIVD